MPAELAKVGFKWIQDGGFWYMVLDSLNPNQVLVTPDRPTKAYHTPTKVYRLEDVEEAVSLNYSQIKSISRAIEKQRREKK